MIIRNRARGDGAALEAMAFLTHRLDGYPKYLPDDLRSFIVNDDALGAWVAEDAGELLGHVALHQRSAPEVMEVARTAAGLDDHRVAVVARLLVSPAARRRGAGRELLGRATAMAARLGRRPVLDVVDEHRGAIALYEDCGWTRVGQVEWALPDGRPLRELVYVGPERPGIDDRYLDTVLVGGRERRVVEIVDYDPEWPAVFEQHRRRIAAALGPAARRVEHIGSTAVPGLAAKPIVDIMVTVGDPEAEESYRSALEEAGYELRVREAGHRMFRTPERQVQVHVWRDGSDDEDRHLLFRDHLRSHAEVRDAYAALKRSLAGEWPDVNYYAEAKGPFIRRVVDATRRSG